MGWLVRLCSWGVAAEAEAMVYHNKTELKADVVKACNDTTSVTLTGADVSRVEDMSSLFKDCTEFNQDISGWDTGKVTI